MGRLSYEYSLTRQCRKHPRGGTIVSLLFFVGVLLLIQTETGTQGGGGRWGGRGRRRVLIHIRNSVSYLTDRAQVPLSKAQVPTSRLVTLIGIIKDLKPLEDLCCVAFLRSISVPI